METRILNNDLERFVLKLEDSGIDPHKFLHAFINQRFEGKDRVNHAQTKKRAVVRNSISGLKV